MLNKLTTTALLTAVLSLSVVQLAQAQMGMGTSEERAAAREARMEKSNSMEFNTAPLIDPNTATEEELSAIEGLSDAGVQAILASRPFATATEFVDAVGEGISEEDKFSVYSAIFVKVNLNRGEEEDFMLVPTTLTPDHIAREYQEYRPFENVEGFRREMGKYVGENETAFLARYIIID